MSEVVAYRISDDIRCLAPPGGENFTQPPDSFKELRNSMFLGLHSALHPSTCGYSIIF